jgi:hypothetical protein
MVGRNLATRHAFLLAAMAAGGPVGAADAPPVPEDFLEYLGSWETDDADWLVASAQAAAVAPKSSNPAPAQASSTTVQRDGAQPPATMERKP